MPEKPVPCHYCGQPATHFCTGCGSWVCDEFRCNARAAAVALRIINKPKAVKWARE